MDVNLPLLNCLNSHLNELLAIQLLITTANLTFFKILTFQSIRLTKEYVFFIQNA